MPCEICGKKSCTKSFHSIETQEEFDSVADKVKDTMRKEFKKLLDDFSDEIVNKDLIIETGIHVFNDLYQQYDDKIDLL